MTTPTDLDRSLTAWLEANAPMTAPIDLVGRIAEGAARTRRRPAWATSERWISMETRARLGAVPRAAVLLVTLAALTALAAGAIALGAGGTALPLPPPTGPAANGLLAFESEGDIWVANPDGSDRRRLTADPGLEVSPVWSRDGTRLAYWARPLPDGPTRLVVIQADGSDPVSITTDDAGRIPLPLDWSPDGSRLAFSFCVEAPCGDFIVAASDGSGVTAIGGPAFQAWRLAWSPDGTSLAFGGQHEGRALGIYLMSPDGSDVRRLGRVTSDDDNGFSSPAWSPDGARIVTHADTDGDGPGIWAIETDGGGEVELTEGSPRGFLPKVSPDGRQVAFESDRSGDVVVIASDGGVGRPLGRTSSHRFAWSPDGTVMAIPRTVDGAPGLAIVDAVTGDLVAEIPGVDGDPSWQRLAP